MDLIEEILTEKDQYLERFHFAAERIQSICEETGRKDCPVNIHKGKVFRNAVCKQMHLIKVRYAAHR